MAKFIVMLKSGTVGTVSVLIPFERGDFSERPIQVIGEVAEVLEEVAA